MTLLTLRCLPPMALQGMDDMMAAGVEASKGTVMSLVMSKQQPAPAAAVAVASAAGVQINLSAPAAGAAPGTITVACPNCACGFTVQVRRRRRSIVYLPPVELHYLL